MMQPVVPNVNLPPIEHTSLPRRVADAIVEFIRSNNLTAGSRLPNEAALAEALNVGRSSLREGMRVLESWGVVHVRGPLGTFVVDPDVGEAPTSLVLPAAREAGELLQAIAIRRELEGLAAELAAQTATLEQVEDIRTELERYEVARRRQGSPIVQGHDFHLSVYRASNNQLLLRLGRGLAEMTERSWGSAFDIPGFADRTVPLHRRILRAIERQDGVEARRLVIEHMDVLEEDIRAAG